MQVLLFRLGGGGETKWKKLPSGCSLAGSEVGSSSGESAKKSTIAKNIRLGLELLD